MDSKKQHRRYRVGIDVGGTFTDLIVLDQESNELATRKILSTPENPALAIGKGLIELLGKGWQEKSQIESITHGSTVATNALLERKGARTALITTEGFKDVYRIGRQNRKNLYDLNIQPALPIIDPSQALEVLERVSASGAIQIPLKFDAGEIQKKLIEGDIESVAISLIFSFANPEHELMLEQWINSLGYFVSRSSDILPEFREFERTSTTLVNAYVSPILNRYLTVLNREVGGSPLRVMQSNGGSIDIHEASRYGVRSILSGPAGGIAAALAHREYGFFPDDKSGLITFDMGGTSTDVSLIKDRPSVIKDAVIGGFPIAIPVIDIHTIGAGGGSIAFIDEGNALRVGPVSAGADPGPACYGKGDLPTVTDANLVLGKILPEYFLGGTMHIDKDRALKAIGTLAEKAELNLLQCAQGIIDIANIHMAKALRVISVERGEDPGDYLLVSFGGAGGLHAVDLAKLVGISRVFIPATAAVFSAFGMLAADAIRDYSLTVMYSNQVDPAHLESDFYDLEQRARMDMTKEGFEEKHLQMERQIDARYQGQSFEIPIPYSPDYQRNFHASHKSLYGYDRPDGNIEIVTLRLKATGKTRPIRSYNNASKNRSVKNALLGMVDVYFNPAQAIPGSVPERTVTPAYHGEWLPEGATLPGPLLIVRNDTTIVIGSGSHLTVANHGSLIVEIGGEND